LKVEVGFAMTLGSSLVGLQEHQLDWPSGNRPNRFSICRGKQKRPGGKCGQIKVRLHSMGLVKKTKLAGRRNMH